MFLVAVVLIGAVGRAMTWCPLQNIFPRVSSRCFKLLRLRYLQVGLNNLRNAQYWTHALKNINSGLKLFSKTHNDAKSNNSSNKGSPNIGNTCCNASYVIAQLRISETKSPWLQLCLRIPTIYSWNIPQLLYHFWYTTRYQLSAPDPRSMTAARAKNELFGYFASMFQIICMSLWVAG